MTQYSIDDLIRTINRDTFSDVAHGAGVRVVLSGKQASLYRPRLLGKLLDGRGNRDVFIKRWSVPKEVKDWQFQWSEGTSAIRLDFDASFVVQANEDMQALGLAKALLSHSDDAGEALYGLINAELHKEVDALLKQCHGPTQTLSLLDEFRRSHIGIGESEKLNRAVSERVAQALGGACFRVGFQLRNLPPMQIELKSNDLFRLADSKLDRKVETTALLRLDNYQVYQKSRLDTEEAVRRTMEKTVARIVKQFLFSRNYYDIVRSFTYDGNSIVDQMKASIQAEALAIGYRVEMFQTFPDIAALKLLEPTRIDIPAQGHKYPLSKSTGFVQIDLSLSVRVASDFSRLHLLLAPDAGDVEQVITARVRQICRDTIQRYDHRDFNLDFDAVIVPKLHTAIVDGLAAYGLEAEVIHIRDLPTEDASRFLSLRGRTIDFKALIAPKADGAAGDPVPVVGSIEVTGMAENGWAQFEGKDFGFRTDSRRSEAMVRIEAAAHDVPLTDQMERRALAIELELAAIRKRVIGILQGALEMGSGLAQEWSSWERSQDILAWAEETSGAAIAREFGLTIALRECRRLDTDAETTLRKIREIEHDRQRTLATETKEDELGHLRDLRHANHKNDMTLVQKVGEHNTNVMLDNTHPDQERVKEEARQVTQRPAQARPRLPGTTSDLLPVKQPSDGDAQAPWRGARLRGGANPDKQDLLE